MDSVRDHSASASASASASSGTSTGAGASTGADVGTAEVDTQCFEDGGERCVGQVIESLASVRVFHSDSGRAKIDDGLLAVFGLAFFAIFFTVAIFATATTTMTTAAAAAAAAAAASGSSGWSSETGTATTISSSTGSGSQVHGFIVWVPLLPERFRLDTRCIDNRTYTAIQK